MSPLDHCPVRRFLVGTHASPPARTEQVVGMAAQVADGMLYLSHHRIVHRDLAARNCLLDQDLNVKVSDFGLSGPIETDSRDFYQILDRTVKVPFRSMPPEFLLYGDYDFQSDVWSFGVLLWEIIRAGATPYTKLSKEEITSSVRRGITLQGSLPSSCPPFLEHLMVKCWNVFPCHRPNFKEIIADLLPTLRQHSPSFQQQFRKDAFYYTLVGEDGLGTIPPPPQIPLPPLPCPHPSTSAYNTQRPTSLHIGSPFHARANDRAHVSVLIDQQGCPKHRRVDPQGLSSPDVTSPTSTVSTLLSPAPLATSEEACDSPRENHILERIKTGLSFIQVPLDTIRSTYSKMSLVRTKEREAKFYSNSDSVLDEAIYVGHDQEDRFSNARVSLNQDLELEDPLPQRNGFYQDMSQATKHQTSSEPEVYEQFESVLRNIFEPEPFLTESVVDDPLETDNPECDHDNLTKVDSSSNLVDAEAALDDTLDARDLSSSCDSLHRNHHSGDDPSGVPIVKHGIETPPPSRNNSVGSSQASSGETIVDLEHTGQLNIMKDPLFVSHCSLHIE